MQWLPPDYAMTMQCRGSCTVLVQVRGGHCDYPEKMCQRRMVCKSISAVAMYSKDRLLGVTFERDVYTLLANSKYAKKSWGPER